VDEDDDEADQKRKIAEASDQEKHLATKLGLRYIKKRIEQAFEIKDSKEWIRTSNKV
jgi:hypothetical protein